MASKMLPYTHGPKRKPPTKYWNLDPMKNGKPPKKLTGAARTRAAKAAKSK